MLEFVSGGNVCALYTKEAVRHGRTSVEMPFEGITHFTKPKLI